MRKQKQKPCAACRCRRKKCKGKECLLAPGFPSDDPDKFLMVQRVFGTSNIIRFLQDVSEDKREDAANSLVFEAKMRIKDPIYGCAGLVYNLQRYIGHLQAQLALYQAQYHVMQHASSSSSSSQFQHQQHLHDSQKQAPAASHCDWHFNNLDLDLDLDMEESVRVSPLGLVYQVPR